MMSHLQYMGLCISLISFLLLSSCIDLDTKSNIDNTNTSVIVIGAGISGLQATRYLSDKGVENITLLEARNRIGGRIHTIDDNGTPIDLGAMWIHGQGSFFNKNPLLALAIQSNTKTKKSNLVDDLVVYNTNGKKLFESEQIRIEAQFNAFLSYLNHTEHHESDSIHTILMQYIENEDLNLTEKNELLFMVNLNIEMSYANDINNLGTNYSSGLAYEGDDMFVLGGYKTIIDQIAKPILDKIKYEEKVIEIDYTDPDNIIVKTENGSTYTANYVICTVPIGVLKSNDITFKPSLPKDKRESLDQLDMNVLNKVFLRFENAFWDTSPYICYIPQKKGEWPLFLNFNYYYKRPILVAFISGNFGLEIETMSNDEIERRIMNVLTTLYPNAEPPLEIYTTRWKSDPLSRGSYASMKKGDTEDIYEILAQPIDDSLIFAGEATHEYNTTVHGAYMSGQRAAEYILDL